ncbi:glycosyltransferase family 2 protein [Desulfitobacterium hafniense]|uniref:glycosyltransferase family 2 protein n=1 Tax=Desulfitobacterium hafniense TaxID=49338 RepID=UPI000371B66B|nr:glycosyltransferase family 2 protein [Desulfitobacterium hafniense]
MKLSACMIARNEEKNIGRCIASYKDVVDEIIVVDTGSTDKTVEIAEAMGAKVYSLEWHNHFAEAKNYALNRAIGDWIIFLDADEYFVNNTARNIIPLLRCLPSRFNAIACRMKNIDYANGQLLDEIMHIRIFRRDKNIRYKNRVHEYLICTTKNNAIEAFYANEKELLIHHEGYSLSDQGSKARRNLEILLPQLDRATEEPTIYYYLGDCYFGLGDWQKAIEYTQLFLASGTQLVGYNVKPHQNIIDSMLRLKCNSDDILKEIHVAINKFPRHPVFHFYLANRLFDLKKYDEAYHEYEKTLQLQKSYDDVEVNSLTPFLYHIYHYMGIVASYRNDYEDALNRFTESSKLEKKQPDCLSRLVMIIKDFPVEDIILFLNSLYNKDDEEELKFLVAALTEVPLPKVLAYYSALEIRKYGSDDLTVVYMLLANRQYDKTFIIAQKCLHEEPKDKTSAAIATVSALMNGNREYLDWVEDHTSEAMGCFIKAMLKHTPFVFSQEDKEDYLNLVTHLLFFGDQEMLKAALRLAQGFAHKSIYGELGNLFFKQEYYAEALELYQIYINLGVAGKEDLAGQIYATGLCWYKLRDYNNAAISLLEAYDSGYRQNDIFEFLRWSVDKLPGDNDLQERYLKILPSPST